MSGRFVDVSGFPAPGLPCWDPIVVKRQEIEQEIERLADSPQPANGIRAANIAHPMSVPPGLGMAPGIDVTLTVLKPGESTVPIRHNSSQVSICIRGTGEARIGTRQFTFERFDIWNTPGMRPYNYRNNSNELMARLSYSNGALLEKLRVHYVEEMPPTGFVMDEQLAARLETFSRKRLVDPVVIGADGAELLTYEHLISPQVVDNQPLLWPWKVIERERERVFPLGRTEKLGRSGLFVLHNPATGRTVGTTHNFFASLGFMPAQVVDRPHRHSSNAINYALEGDMISDVNGIEVEWSQGDLAYTAPGWSLHANGSRDRSGGTALTIQDHPFQIATDCLIWQEREDKPILLLGSQLGFQLEDEASVVATLA